MSGKKTPSWVVFRGEKNTETVSWKRLNDKEKGELQNRVDWKKVWEGNY